MRYSTKKNLPRATKKIVKLKPKAKAMQQFKVYPVLKCISFLCPNLMNLSRVSNPPKTGFNWAPLVVWISLYIYCLPITIPDWFKLHTTYCNRCYRRRQQKYHCNILLSLKAKFCLVLNKSKFQFHSSKYILY